MDTNINKMIRIGEVSSINPANMTVRVTYPDEQGLVSDELLVGNRGSKNNKDYWLPDVGEQVLCVFPPNSRNKGYCICSFFSDVDVPPSGAATGKRILNLKGDLEINCTGSMNLNASRINLNEGR